MKTYRCCDCGRQITSDKDLTEEYCDDHIEDGCAPGLLYEMDGPDDFYVDDDESEADDGE